MNTNEFLCLQTQIAAWDQKSADDIRGIYDAYKQKPEFIPGLLKLISDDHTSSGATWCLKAALEDGYVLSAAESNTICSCLHALNHWQSKLHVLQCFQHLKIIAQSKSACEAFVRKTLIDKNKFLRAWAYHGFHCLSQAYPELKEEFEKVVAIAMRDEAPSVKARIRNLKQ